jgi:hypothetical protein
LAANSSKVQAALKLSQNDRSSIAALKKEVKKAWKMVEAGVEKENRAKEAIARMKIEVESLRANGGNGDGMGTASKAADADADGDKSAGASPFIGGYSKLMETHFEQEEQIIRLKRVNLTLYQNTLLIIAIHIGKGNFNTILGN